MLAFVQHAERCYRAPDGKPTSEFTEIKLMVKALRELYGDAPATESAPLEGGSAGASERAAGAFGV